MEIKLKLPDIGTLVSRHAGTVFVSLAMGVLGAVATHAVFNHYNPPIRVATVDILAIENNDEQELTEAIRKNDQEKAKRLMSQRLSRSKLTLSTVNEVAIERGVVVVVSQAIAGGDVPDITQDVLRRMQEQY